MSHRSHAPPPDSERSGRPGPARRTPSGLSDPDGSRPLLRFVTCGSVDDGKSTLIGRLLFESRKVFKDHLEAVERDSKKYGTQGDKIDLALLVDGLSSEREQGITIDVAYRYFDTDRRKFIVADTPGHEQYTRNMATGASTADVAVLLIDARKGVLTQTRRHSLIVSLLGIENIVLAVNKMDLVNYDQTVYGNIVEAYLELATRLKRSDERRLRVAAIPLSALQGDNVVDASTRMPWYGGPTLLHHLETVSVDPLDSRRARPAALRFPVQWVNRPSPDFRGLAGQVTEGSIRPKDPVRILPSGRTSAIHRIVTKEGDLNQANTGQSVTLVLEDDVDVARGDMVCAADAPAQVADQFQTTIVWMSEQPMLPGRSYVMKIGPQTAIATVTALRYRLDIERFRRIAASMLELNAVGVCNVSSDRPIAFDPYSENRDTGGFILIDRITNATVGAGMIHFALRRAGNIHWQEMEVDKIARARMKHQRPLVLWFTGLPASGKTTIANAVEKKLAVVGRHTYTLDGDNIRHGLNRDLGFTAADRVENIRRIAEVAKLMTDAGLITLVSFISPFRADRRRARELFDEGDFVEVHVDTPLAVAEARDVKGLYAKARAGQLTNMTGVDSPYEPPETPEIRIDTTQTTPEEAADLVLRYLEGRLTPA